MHQIQIACDRRGTSTGRRGSRATCGMSSQRPAPRRVGHLGDRHRRRHRPVHRRGHAGRRRDRPPSRSRHRPSRTARYADDLLTTLRRAPDAEPGDQVVVLTSRDQFTLEQTGHLGPAGDARHVLARATSSERRSRSSRSSPAPFSTVGTESMVPISHILWSHLWLGIATDAFDRARAFVGRQRQGQARTSCRRPPSACRS